MEPQSDFKELLGLFNNHKVEYIIVGGYALAFHGAPRFTGDIDIFVNHSLENSQKILSALDEFGFGALGLAAEDFQTPEKIIQLGVPPEPAEGSSVFSSAGNHGQRILQRDEPRRRTLWPCHPRHGPGGY